MIEAADDMRQWYRKQMGPDGPEMVYDTTLAAYQATRGEPGKEGRLNTLQKLGRFAPFAMIVLVIAFAAEDQAKFKRDLLERELRIRDRDVMIINLRHQLEAEQSGRDNCERMIDRCEDWRARAIANHDVDCRPIER